MSQLIFGWIAAGSRVDVGRGRTSGEVVRWQSVKSAADDFNSEHDASQPFTEQVPGFTSLSPLHGSGSDYQRNPVTTS